MLTQKQEDREHVYNRSEQIKEVNVATRYQAGVSGNPAGRPKNSVTTLLKNTDKETTQKIAKKIREKAVEGDLGFTNLYIDRTDGKVKGDDVPLVDNRSITINVGTDRALELTERLLKGGLIKDE